MSNQRQLTDKQLAFCNEYLIDYNARAAAIRAGYSASTAAKGTLMQIPQVKEYIKQEYDEQIGRINVTKDMIVQEMAKIAFSDILDLYNADGSVKNLDELDDKARASVASMRIDDIYSADKKHVVGKSTRIKMFSKISALEKLARQLGMDKTIYRSWNNLQ